MLEKILLVVGGGGISLSLAKYLPKAEENIKNWLDSVLAPLGIILTYTETFPKEFAYLLDPVIACYYQYRLMEAIFEHKTHNKKHKQPKVEKKAETEEPKTEETCEGPLEAIGYCEIKLPKGTKW